jgi:hypothetical protein
MSNTPGGFDNLKGMRIPANNVKGLKAFFNKIVQDARAKHKKNKEAEKQKKQDDQTQD